MISHRVSHAASFIDSKETSSFLFVKVQMGSFWAWCKFSTIAIRSVPWQCTMRETNIIYIVPYEVLYLKNTLKIDFRMCKRTSLSWKQLLKLNQPSSGHNFVNTNHNWANLPSVEHNFNRNPPICRSKQFYKYWIQMLKRDCAPWFRWKNIAKETKANKYFWLEFEIDNLVPSVPMFPFHVCKLHKFHINHVLINVVRPFINALIISISWHLGSKIVLLTIYNHII